MSAVVDSIDPGCLFSLAAGIRCVKIFSSGTRAVSGSLDHTLLLWNLITGKKYLCIQEDHTTYENAYLQVDEKIGVIYSAAGSKVRQYPGL